MPCDIDVGLRIEYFHDRDINIDVYVHEFFDDGKIGMITLYSAVVHFLKEHGINAVLYYDLEYKIEVEKSCYDSVIMFMNGVHKCRFAERDKFIIEDIDASFKRISVITNFIAHEFIRFSIRNAPYISAIFVNNVLISILNTGLSNITDIIASGDILDIYFDKRFQ